MKKRKKEQSTASLNFSADVRRGTSVEAIKQAVMDNLNFAQGRVPLIATRNDWYMALAYTVRDRMFDHWIRALQTHVASGYQNRQLSVRGISHGPASRQRADQSRHISMKPGKRWLSSD